MSFNLGSEPRAKYSYDNESLVPMSFNLGSERKTSPMDKLTRLAPMSFNLGSKLAKSCTYINSTRLRTYI